MFPLINTLPELSAKKPALVVAVVVAFATLPTFIEPAEFKVTFPPINVELAIVQPPISPPVNWTDEPVICPLLFITNLALELDTVVSLNPNPPIVPPKKLTNEPVILPLSLKISEPLELDIDVSLTRNPAIEADVNLAAPCSVILAFALSTVEPAGVNIELAEKVPCTVTSLVITPPSINTFDAVKFPSALTWNLEADIKLFCFPFCVGIPAAEPDM